MLGMGALPVTWLATRHDPKDKGSEGTGLSPEGHREEPLSPAEIGTWRRAHQCWRQTRVLMVCGLTWGLLGFLGQVFLLAKPALAMVAEVFHGCDQQAHLLWLAFTLIGPTLTYKAMTSPTACPPKGATELKSHQKRYQALFSRAPAMLAICLALCLLCFTAAVSGSLALYQWLNANYGSL